MLFSELLSRVGDTPSTLEITPDWMQGRATFGGLGAALAYESMRRQVSEDLPVRCLQIAFIGPIDDQPLTVESKVLRQGKSVAQVLGSITQAGQTKLMVQGAFGKARESAIAVAGAPMRFEQDPGTIEPMPYIEGIIPAFTQHFDFRYCTAMPFMGSDATRMRGFVRFKEEPQHTLAHLLALVDAWPPTTLPMLKRPAPASSLTWTVEFVHPLTALRQGEYTQYEAEIVDSHQGYGHTRAKIWNEAGELLAISQQTVTHFA
ncbi:MAG: thioesterase family protein [Oleiphilaceae bacterium]|nr:thioesterase family protein [Oleiphilaceae bacterium]